MLNKHVLTVLFIALLILDCSEVQAKRFRILSPKWVENFENALFTTNVFILKQGYAVEMHNVESKDGYVSELYRIPCGYHDPCHKRTSGKPPVLLFPSFYNSAYTYVLQPNISIGYGLADRGYDVWLANLRGQSQNENTFFSGTLGKSNWHFSLDNMIKHDVPELIDYVLNITNKRKVAIIGHSMGTTVTLGCLSDHPEYNKKVQVAFLMAPAVYVAPHTGPLHPITRIPLGPTLFKMWQMLFWFNKSQPSGYALRILGFLFCNNFKIQSEFCLRVMAMGTGFDPEGVSSAIMPPLVNHVSSTSAMTAIQFLQHTQYGRFAHFNFGPQLNRLKYNSTRPPLYDLRKVTAPIFLLNAANDQFTNQKNIDYITSRLKNLQKSYVVPYKKLDHLGFVLSHKIAAYVNPFIYKELGKRNPSVAKYRKAGKT